MKKKPNHLGVSKNRGTPKGMAKIMENPIQMDELGGTPTIFGNIHLISPQFVKRILRNQETLRSRSPGRWSSYLGQNMSFFSNGGKKKQTTLGWSQERLAM